MLSFLDYAAMYTEYTDVQAAFTSIICATLCLRTHIEDCVQCYCLCTGVQAAFTSIICATLFLRTHIAPDGIDNAHLYAGFLFFASLQMFFNGIAEMTFTVG